MGSLLQDKSNPDGTAYRRARVYDYETGRFTQEDPAGLAGGTNAYGFAGGDPVNYDDPFGLCPSCLALELAGLGASEEAVPVVGQIVGTATLIAAAGVAIYAAADAVSTTLEARGGSMVPDPAAEGPHTTIKTDATGKVKKYQEWNLPTDPRDKRDFEPGKRFDKNGPAHTNPDELRFLHPIFTTLMGLHGQLSRMKPLNEARKRCKTI
jgi:RHS repeat-associated protein